MRIAYMFATSGHTVSYKLQKMILPRSKRAITAPTSSACFSDDSTFSLRAGDPLDERLDQVASDTDILGMMCDQCALERGLATGQPGEATATGAVECVTVGCFPDLAPMRPRGARAMLAAPSENTWRRANDGAAVNRYATGIWRRMAASAVVGVLVLSGCGGGSADKAGETAGGAVTASDATAGRTLRVAAGSEFAAQDPHDYAGDFILLDMVFEPLVRYGEDGVLKPALATAWRVSKDGLTVHSICVRT